MTATGSLVKLAHHPKPVYDPPFEHDHDRWSSTESRLRAENAALAEAVGALRRQVHALEDENTVLRHQLAEATADHKRRRRR